MISKCQCQHCNGEIEFDAADFEFSSENDVRRFGQTIPCPHCGMETAIYLTKEIPAPIAPKPAPSVAPKLRTAPALQPSAQAAKESIFFQSGNITVTNARFIVGAKTFAMRSITSVQSVSRKEEPLGITGMGCLSVIIFMLGLVISCCGFGSSTVWLGVFGILIIAGGVWLAIRALPSQPKPKTIFTVVLTTAGGEVTAYQSDDQNHISQIIRALNDSIISHG
jgi:hypothetical protein